MSRAGFPSDVEVLHRGRYLSLVDKDGWEYVTRPHVTGIVVIAALTADKKLVLVEQLRRAVRSHVVELPAGMVGDEPGQHDESLATAAHRELIEETGFAAREMVQIAEGPIAVGVSDEVVTFFHARDLTRVGPGGGVESENIVVHEVPLTELRAFLAAKQRAGLLVDPKIYAALFLLGEAAP
jgi:ADP-ribose pyrophosphatase